MALQLAQYGPVTAPGKCVSCGAADFDRKYIDLGFDIDFYGRVYTCIECFSQGVEELGLHPNNDLKLRIIELETALEEANARAFDPGNLLGGISDLIASVDQDALESVRRGSNDDPGAEKSIAQQGSNDVLDSGDSAKSITV
jgi:hypothetical protein